MRFGAFANIDGERRLSSGPVFTASIVVDAATPQRSHALAEGQVLHTNLTCPCDFVGLVNATCPDGTNVSLSCDGRPRHRGRGLRGGHDECTHPRMVNGFYDANCKRRSSRSARLCASVPRRPGTHSTGDGRAHADQRVQRPFDGPARLPEGEVGAYDAARALWVLRPHDGYGRADAMDKREHEFSRSLDSLFDGLDSRLGGKGVGRFDDLARPWTSCAATGLRVQPPFVNYYCIYSKTIPRGWRAWVCGFEVLAFCLY